MFEFFGEVAMDFAGMLVNPASSPSHPVASAVALALVGVLAAAGLAVIYVQDGVIAL